MSFPYSLHEKAYEEYIDAYDWYELRSTGLGDRFMNCVEKRIGFISQNPEYYRLTYTLTLNVAQTLSKLNPDMTFCYVSGAGTDSSEQGRSMWARVKGKTENDLMKLPFKHVYAFRPGYMHPTPGLKNVNKYYKYIAWMYPLLRLVFPGGVSTLAELGEAMINITLFGYVKQIIEVKDIVRLAKID